MSKRTNKSNHNKQLHIQVNNKWNKAFFKLSIFTGTEPHILLPSQHSSSHSAALLWWIHQRWALLLRCASQS